MTPYYLKLQKLFKTLVEHGIVKEYSITFKNNNILKYGKRKLQGKKGKEET